MPNARSGQPRVQLQLFGQLRISVDDQPISVDSTRGQALIAFLVLGGDAPRSREQAAFALWPDSTDSQARTNLRKTLHGLRQNPELERIIEVTPRSLRWRREETHRIDVDEFEWLLGASAGAADEGEAVAALRRAADLYTGPVLVDCWDEWLVDHRTRLGELHVGGLRGLAESLGATGQLPEAVRVGQEVVRCEPLQEASYRLLMSLFVASGDRAAAARVYHQCVSVLRDELGVGPSIDTTAAYNELTDAQTDPVSDRSSGGNEASRPSLVGRTAEWEALTNQWPEPDGAAARLVLVTGEPGIGKTYLVESFATWAGRRGAVIAEARSFATEGELGFGLLIAWLRSPALRDALESLPDADRAVLARLLPELGDAADDSALDHAERRQRLFDAVARVLGRVAEDRPLVLVADDAQWTDELSLQAARYVVRSNAEARLLVVATVRREDLAPSAAIDQIAVELGAAGLATEIAVGRLDLPDTEELARQLIGGDLPQPAVQQLHAESEGNPLFIVEAVRAGWQGADGELPLSPRLRQLIDVRVHQLSPDAQQLLQAAVAVGREFRVSVVEQVSGLDELAAVRALDELWRRGFINEFSVDAYDFTHGKIRDAVYDSLSPPVRRRLHRRLAVAVQTVDRGSIDSASGRIAYHFDQGGEALDAVIWYGRAADQAQRLYAPVEAVRLLERALELVEELPDDVRAERELEVLSALPTPVSAVDGYSSDRVVSIQERAVRVASERGVDVQPTVLRSLGFLRLCHNEYVEAGELARQLSTQAQRDGDRALLIEGIYLQGVAAFWRGDFGEAKTCFETVVDRDARDLRADLLVRFGQDSQIVCRSRLANTLRFMGDVDAAIATRELAIADAVEVGHPWTLNLVLIFASLLAVDLGEGDRLREYAGTMGAIGLESRPYRLHTKAIAGAARAFAGHPHDGIATIRAAIEETGPINPAPGFRSLLWRLLVAAHQVAGGSVEDAVRACDGALQIDGSQIWWPDIRRAREAFISRR